MSTISTSESIRMIDRGYPARLRRSTKPNTGFAQIATVGANVASYGDTGVSANKTYYYRVRAFNGAGNSPYSNVASAMTPK